ncbi:DNA gyrase inhibitor YacG [Saccharophagus degradans]|uniref:DNA gyrase inhibitor YacG n=2 Tax=Saccharophagus degradans TaxID=86304 RepID=Q21MF8_SACD2|nr:DNA gyrase inhibitor YacG [Saccharophagus degradans]ABD80121.1 protein of unknown function DUF329 [Saccharophagus degradans 2-40]MBU2984512.1 DNA gyrase inhibitor YacG [Saccharophagus degradans]MDO6423216.1 DNA gyrase inhibitor YacG [Saccharophagus degradans]MDO6607260.1 DNA gyrase inhibitor YacG [Saccharophagus degradans]WGO97698.1 DNA gyrase inhibitor YacG [Saccharophagus degradans]
MNVKTLAVACPTCKKQVLMTTDFPNRPFCSKRCQMIDFGDWAEERHAIKGQELTEDEDIDDCWSSEFERD